MSSPAPGVTAALSPFTKFLVFAVAAVGFFLDTYQLLMFPVFGARAISELLNVPITHPDVRAWIGKLLWISALCGGVFGLLGGFLIDRFGRRTVMIGSIFVYSLSPVLAAFSTELWMLILFRCITFIGVCVEFVAAITWLAELFEDKRSRELALGWTLAFASFGGLFVSMVFRTIVSNRMDLPALPLPDGFDQHAAWRYTLLTGVVPALLIALFLPFVPESRVWAERKRAGALRRPRFAELFSPGLLRTTLVTTGLSASAYAAAFGALQLTPTQIVPGFQEFTEPRAALEKKEKDLEKIKANLDTQTSPTDKAVGKAKLDVATKEFMKNRQDFKDATDDRGGKVQLWQELGGLVGRILLAILVIYVVSRRLLIQLFLAPGLILFPLTYYVLFRDHQDMFVAGIFLCGLCTVAQFSYLGEYLPKAFPVHLRGTGGSFATNVGGRMIGTFAAMLNTSILAPMFGKGPVAIATAAAIIGGSVFLIGLILSMFLREPKMEDVG